MKMKNKNKGKIHPSPPSSNSLSILSLLPSTILTLIPILSLEDKQALAYMLTRYSTTKKTSKHSKNTTTPVFDCDCFECYTSYWHQWDTSPNREIIHLAIEAFEEREDQIRAQKRRERAAAVKPLLHDVSQKSVDEVVVVAGVDDVPVPARRVLPEVVGMIRSRLWSFWSHGTINNNIN